MAKVDMEMLVISRILKLLNPLDRATQQRIVKYLNERISSPLAELLAKSVEEVTLFKDEPNIKNERRASL
jgi:hypothetical protein